jgi:hypothetical protein
MAQQYLSSNHFLAGKHVRTLHCKTPAHARHENLLTWHTQILGRSHPCPSYYHVEPLVIETDANVSQVSGQISPNSRQHCLLRASKILNTIRLLPKRIIREIYQRMVLFSTDGQKGDVAFTCILRYNMVTTHLSSDVSPAVVIRAYSLCCPEQRTRKEKVVLPGLILLWGAHAGGAWYV